MSNITLNVTGMSCNHCVKSVEEAVKNAGANGKVDLAAGTVAVEYDEQKVNVDQIKAAIEDQGYDVV
ncbi:copper ion binding protein [Paenibacillus sp. UMB7766-LJ446]|jgi:copper chaperone|nr:MULTISPECIES: copper ion binding protein [Paenibacillus]OPG96906.1 copper resistance protein CopZ [Chryseobacterium mucoviscidosis]MDK8192903.1 copper ion binding protein [Paenibacillus sp. UMB7766-LJ446]MDN4602595.1 copper ion binding protein [Paenibacillus vandeheii]MDN8592954.1 copper ion binding protein [Paenibacillus sp. 11B]SLK08436.1 copper chaperone [Paenibacillus sp. RU5A]